MGVWICLTLGKNWVRVATAASEILLESVQLCEDGKAAKVHWQESSTSLRISKRNGGVELSETGTCCPEARRRKDSKQQANAWHRANSREIGN